MRGQHVCMSVRLTKVEIGKNLRKSACGACACAHGCTHARLFCARHSRTYIDVAVTALGCSKSCSLKESFQEQSQQLQFMRANDKHRTDARACVHVRMHMHMRHRHFYTKLQQFPPILSACSALVNTHPCVCLHKHIAGTDQA